MLLDTTTIIEIFRTKRGSKIFQKIMDMVSEEELFISLIQLAEVADWCARNERPIIERISFVKEFANVVPLDDEICLEGAKIKKEKRDSGQLDFGLIDGIILATARSVGQRLLSFDHHFIGESDCIVL